MRCLPRAARKILKLSCRQNFSHLVNIPLAYDILSFGKLVDILLGVQGSYHWPSWQSPLYSELPLKRQEKGFLRRKKNIIESRALKLAQNSRTQIFAVPWNSRIFILTRKYESYLLYPSRTPPPKMLWLHLKRQGGSKDTLRNGFFFYSALEAGDS